MNRSDELTRRTRNALIDLAILAGDIPNEHDVAWQDVAATAAINLRGLANLIDAIRKGETHYQGYALFGPVHFPSPTELLEAEETDEEWSDETSTPEDDARSYGPHFRR